MLSELALCWQNERVMAARAGGGAPRRELAMAPLLSPPSALQLPSRSRRMTGRTVSPNAARSPPALTQPARAPLCRMARRARSMAYPFGGALVLFQNVVEVIDLAHYAGGPRSALMTSMAALSAPRLFPNPSPVPALCLANLFVSGDDLPASFRAERAPDGTLNGSCQPASRRCGTVRLGEFTFSISIAFFNI